jgi:hypothetical protein
MNPSLESWIILAVVVTAALHVARRVVRIIRMKHVGCDCGRAGLSCDSGERERLHKITRIKSGSELDSN